MEWSLPEATQRIWRHRSRSSGQHPAAHYQDKPRWDSSETRWVEQSPAWKIANVASEVTGAPWIWYFVSDSIQEKCIEQDRPLYMVFVDFSKAFDTVGRTGLWQLLRKYGCPEKFTTMIWLYIPEWWCGMESLGIVQCYKWGQARLCTGPHALRHLPISNARRGFPRHGGWRLHIQSWQSANLLNFAHFRAQTKTTRTLVRELLLADDSAQVAHSAEMTQKIVDAFSDALTQRSLV